MKTTMFLKKAKALIVKYGWMQHDSGSKHNGFCMTGALNEVPHNCDFSGETCICATAEKFLLRATKYQDLVGYNDTQSRTKEQILGRFDRAIKLAKNS